MSRLRFLSMEAISKVAEVTYSGPGWDNYDNDLSVAENIHQIYRDSYPDWIDVYKPLEMKSFKGILCPVSIRYNEMAPDYETRNRDIKKILREIRHTRANLIICHHLNDMHEWSKRLCHRIEPRFQLANIPHCAEKTIFKDYGLPKKWDLLLIGSQGPRYPLRERFRKILQRMSAKWRCHVWKHPGYKLTDTYTNRHLIEFAKAINSAKICCSCSGRPRSRYSKYAEVPMCGTAFAADLPDENHEFFEQFLIVVDMSMSDEEIIRKLEYYLTHDEKREKLVKKGLELSQDYTFEKYAERFLNLAKDFLKSYEKANSSNRYAWGLNRIFAFHKKLDH